MNNTFTSSKETKKDFQAPLLPRFAWNSQLAHLRVIFKAKKALDRIEKDVRSPRHN